MSRAKGVAFKRPFPLSRFISCLVAIFIHGNIWYWINIYYGNAVALEVLGWLSAFPLFLRHIAAVMPSAGQFYLEERWEEEGRMKALFEQGIVTEEEYDNSKLDWQTLAFITVCSTVLDLLGPAIGIVVTVQRNDGAIGLFFAIGLAAIASWGSQHFMWKSIKEAAGMLWYAWKDGGREFSAPHAMLASKMREKHKGQDEEKEVSHPNGRGK